jgi:hypothetical protein
MHNGSESEKKGLKVKNILSSKEEEWWRLENIGRRYKKK